MTRAAYDVIGIGNAIVDVLAHAGVSVVDIEQIVVRRRLVLAVLVTAPRDSKRVRDTVTGALAGLGMTVDIEQGSGDNRGGQYRTDRAFHHASTFQIVSIQSSDTAKTNSALPLPG